jgi:hypothetical protein
MLSTNKTKEMKRRASQRRASHKARLAALGLRAETQMAALDKTEKVASKGDVKSTAKTSKPTKKKS